VVHYGGGSLLQLLGERVFLRKTRDRPLPGRRPSQTKRRTAATARHPDKTAYGRKKNPLVPAPVVGATVGERRPLTHQTLSKGEGERYCGKSVWGRGNLMAGLTLGGAVRRGIESSKTQSRCGGGGVSNGIKVSNFREKTRREGRRYQEGNQGGSRRPGLKRTSSSASTTSSQAEKEKNRPLVEL